MKPAQNVGMFWTWPFHFYLHSLPDPSLTSYFVGVVLCQVLYVMELRQDMEKGKANFTAVSEFLLTHPVLSFGVRDVAHTRLQHTEVLPAEEESESMTIGTHRITGWQLWECGWCCQQHQLFLGCFWVTCDCMELNKVYIYLLLYLKFATSVLESQGGGFSLKGEHTAEFRTQLFSPWRCSHYICSSIDLINTTLQFMCVYFLSEGVQGPTESKSGIQIKLYCVHTK